MGNAKLHGWLLIIAVILLVVLVVSALVKKEIVTDGTKSYVLGLLGHNKTTPSTAKS